MTDENTDQAAEGAGQSPVESEGVSTTDATANPGDVADANAPGGAVRNPEATAEDIAEREAEPPAEVAEDAANPVEHEGVKEDE